MSNFSKQNWKSTSSTLFNDILLILNKQNIDKNTIKYDVINKTICTVVLNPIYITSYLYLRRLLFYLKMDLYIISYTTYYKYAYFLWLCKKNIDYSSLNMQQNSYEINKEISEDFFLQSIYI